MSDDIMHWLAGLGLGKYLDVFVENEISMASLRHLTEDDFKELGLPMGPRKVLAAAIANLAESGQQQTTRPKQQDRRDRGAERRQLTVLFCDLVGSTELSRRLDPEDMRDVIGRYQDTVAGSVARFEGHVARFLGDGVLAYFGWPQADEDQAERAVLAGLEAVRKVTSIALEDGERLQARVGIATGRVVVGDIVGEHSTDTESVTGETPNLAARLQGVARPGQVILGAMTHRLVRNAFDLEELPPVTLKGFSDPVALWAVRGEKAVDSRFDAAHGSALSALVGRQFELDQLSLSWNRARAGHGQVILLSGEAGIGKSRIAQTFCRSASLRDASNLQFQCSPLHSNSAFHPIIQRLERMASFAEDDDAGTRLDKLEGLLRAAGQDVEATMPLFAELLSIATGDRYAAPNPEPQERRDRTIGALIEFLLSFADGRPITVLLEDAHWMDPSSSAFFDALLPRIATTKVLLIVTLRAETATRWDGHDHVKQIALRRLLRPECLEIIAEASGRELSEAIVERILDRADGVPLYLEELTRAVVENESLPGGEDGEAIPATLHASLTARLDRLGEAKEFVQIGAVVGRTFSPRLVAAVAGRTVDETIRLLDSITEMGLVSRQSAGQETDYVFRHALIQDVAYDTLLRQQRRRAHARVADLMPVEFPKQTEIAPEQVAHHLSKARLAERAVEYWQRAGRRAAQRSAHVEAIAHLEQGLSDLARIPASPTHDQQEFALRIALGASLLTVEGWSSPKVAENYLRAQELSAAGGDVRQLFMAIRGLSNVYFLNGEIRKAQQMVDGLLTMAKEQQDRELLLQSHMPMGMCMLMTGEFDAAMRHLQQALALYDRDRHQALAFVYGIDPGVVALSASAWAHWFLGRPVEAKRSCETAIRLAVEQEHPFSLTYAQSLAASLHQFRRDPDAVLEHANTAIEISRTHDYPYWRSWATIMRGWAVAAKGAPSDGIAQLMEGLAGYERAGARQIVPYAKAMLAEMHGWAGDPEHGIQAADSAFGEGNSSDVRFFEAEAMRIRGVLTAATDARAARDYLDQACDLAQRQNARLFALRSAVSAANSSIRADADIQRVREWLEGQPPDLAEPDLIAARHAVESAGGTS